MTNPQAPTKAGLPELALPLRAEKQFCTIKDAKGRHVAQCPNYETAALIVARLNSIAAVIEGLDMISRDAWSGEHVRMNRMGRMADKLKAALAAGE